MQDTCLPQNYVNCIGKVKVCGCRRFRESVLYGQCLFCSSPCLPLSYFLLVRLSCSFPPEVLSRISLSAFCILLSFPPLQFSPVSSVCLPLSFLCFIIFLYYVHFLDTFIPYYNKRPPRGGQGLCFKWLLEITKLFHTHTGRRNPSGPPK